MSDEQMGWSQKITKICPLCGFAGKQCSCNGKQKSQYQIAFERSVKVQKDIEVANIKAGYAKEIAELKKKIGILDTEIKPEPELDIKEKTPETKSIPEVLNEAPPEREVSIDISEITEEIKPGKVIEVEDPNQLPPELKMKAVQPVKAIVTDITQTTKEIIIEMIIKVRR